MKSLPIEVDKEKVKELKDDVMQAAAILGTKPNKFWMIPPFIAMVLGIATFVYGAFFFTCEWARWHVLSILFSFGAFFTTIKLLRRQIP